MSADGAKLSPDGVPAPRTKSPSPLSISPANGSVNSSKQSLDPQTEFSGDLETNNVLPSQETLKKIEDYQILDVEGRTVPFKSIYTGPNVARRVLVIFVRHFFCGNCQEYLKLLSESITPDSLLSLPIPTFIAVVGCGSPSLIPMYAEATGCPFPIYADPTKALYNELGMSRTLNMGNRPDYQRRSVFGTVVSSIVQSLKQVPSGKVLAGGDIQQVGGEFLFEPVDGIQSPVQSPAIEGGEHKQLGLGVGKLDTAVEKRVTWCHRMRNTRDHAEIPELREVLGLDGHGSPGKNKRRWSKAVEMRKGTGFSQMSGLTEEGAVLTGKPSRSDERIAEEVKEDVKGDKSTERKPVPLPTVS